ncbi:CRISPR-associated endonuclease Cas2 [Candidatus Giovannonibacteria bacterium RIFCSPHIGHO2_02_43_16]|uniref:CRISPR-associated endonuclease Cas2 n=1 Tax=Candidatus Giovannonibacteria bacterium RIFCSPHIGHO2_02_43_16 TaxID=1798331 RepID=A0A1F5WEM4_9BACT|nr:MAG: CRISPR-associated endonuclease Cas2 [Candidatus Giovannonibacteria bacterium RIFCSPHIGHO2_02_43_16]OGG65751.1 MAG: CRISPR-associated endonuclease Cas2 [Candidatus Kaiserbacteria bacterium RIFCSPHIGHO2_12_45_16]
MRKIDSWGPVAQKILLLLLGGVALGLARSPRQYFYIIKNIKKDWRTIEKRKLYYSLNKLRKEKYIEIKNSRDGSAMAVLTEKGRNKALAYSIDEMMIPPMARWDKKWRIILFDIPEKHKKARNALAAVLKRMGWYQFQKSVFVHPFECENEINFVVRFFNIEPYVSLIKTEDIDRETELRAHFKSLMLN